MLQIASVRCVAAAALVLASCTIDLVPDREAEIGQVGQAATAEGGSVTVNAMNINAMNINAMNINAMNINAMNINAMNINAMNINAMNINAMNINAMNINALVTDALATDSMFRIFMYYFIQCAVPDGMAVVFYNQDQIDAAAQGLPISTSADGLFPMVFYGRLGVAPEVLTGDWTDDSWERITGCMAAHANKDEVMVLISLEMDGYLTRGEYEEEVFQVFEAGNYGNLLHDGGPVILGYDRDLTQIDGDIPGPPVGVGARACTEQQLADGTCLITAVGWSELPEGASCGTEADQELLACNNADADTCYSDGFCTSPDDAAEAYHSNMRIYRANRTLDGIPYVNGSLSNPNAHYDYEEGAALDMFLRAETPCTYKLAHESGLTGCHDYDYGPECVQWAVDNCANDGYSLLEEGPPKVVGRSDCINLICTSPGIGKESCCKHPRAGGWWDAECVGLAWEYCTPSSAPDEPINVDPDPGDEPPPPTDGDKPIAIAPDTGDDKLPVPDGAEPAPAPDDEDPLPAADDGDKGDDTKVVTPVVRDSLGTAIPSDWR